MGLGYSVFYPILKGCVCGCSYFKRAGFGHSVSCPIVKGCVWMLIFQEGVS